MIWNLHSHSRFSAQDALPTPEAMVATVKAMGQPALGLTDHGNMAGTVQLYSAAKKAGILPFPGSELYVVSDRRDKKEKRRHMCVVAYTSEGYANLVRLSTATHRNFHHKPLVDFADLAELADTGGLRGLAATSGCYFGFVSQNVVAGNEQAARTLLKHLDACFDRFYVELQNHNIDHGDGWSDDTLADWLLGAATEIGLPCVLTQDSHYCDIDQKGTHDALKRLVSFGPDPDDAVFPGDGFHLADAEWFESHHSEARLRAGREGLSDLLDAHDLTIPQLDRYSYNIPITVADPQQELENRCHGDGWIMRGLGTNAKYEDRLCEELAVIKDTGMAGYLMLVAEVTDWCRDHGVFYQARGSASGSIVCWLLGITQADPMKWGLSFDRFISRDRTKPPDVDLDVEHDRRHEIIDWLSTRFSVTQIGTWAEAKLSAEDDESGEETKGALRVRYYSRWRATHPNVDPPPWNDVPENDKKLLYDIAALKTFSSYGVHAAGLVLTSTPQQLHDLVPQMMVASSSTMVTQYEMDDVEALGLVKLDLLGLRTLSVLRQTMNNLDRPVDDLDWIPLTDRKTFAEIAKGHTDGVFQLEGNAARRGVKELKPTTIRDIIAAMALFRPATMNSGATGSYIARKHKREAIPQRHPILDAATEKTYGILLFQEQVIHILRNLGMEANDLTSFLKAVKASNSAIGDAGKVIESYEGLVMAKCIKAGMTEKDFDWLWESITGFAAYGFNQAHSTAYGITAYRCAYLRTHHSLEFHAALLSVASGTKKESQYAVAARAQEHRLIRPDVNYSGISYTVDQRRQAIRRGLTSIDGVGASSAVKIYAERITGGPFQNLHDFCARMHKKINGTGPYLRDGDISVGVVGRLDEANALGSLKEMT